LKSDLGWANRIFFGEQGFDCCYCSHRSAWTRSTVNPSNRSGIRRGLPTFRSASYIFFIFIRPVIVHADLGGVVKFHSYFLRFGFDTRGLSKEKRRYTEPICNAFGMLDSINSIQRIAKATYLSMKRIGLKFCTSIILSKSFLIIREAILREIGITKRIKDS
jgi:hypothetical protein